jgi:hydrogenase maturation protease
MKTILVGMGNSVFHDDAAGIQVVRALNGKVNIREVDIVETSCAGLDLLDILSAYDKAVIIDAIHTPGGRPGRVHKFSPGMVKTGQKDDTPHNMDLIDALRLGKELGIRIPDEIIIFGIEAANTDVPDSKLTPEVEKAIHLCTEIVLQELNSTERLSLKTSS